MKVVVWIVSVLLALFAVQAGVSKLLLPPGTWDGSATPAALYYVAAVAETLGGIGVVLPAATRIMPVLTPLAASGLVVVFVGATIVNAIDGLYSYLPMTLILAAVAAFVAWARFGPYAVRPRGDAPTAA